MTRTTIAILASLSLTACASLPEQQTTENTKDLTDFSRSASDFSVVNETDSQSAVKVFSKNTQFQSLRRVENAVKPEVNLDFSLTDNELDLNARLFASELFPEYDFSRSEITRSRFFVYVKLQQSFDGLNVFNAILNLRLNKSGNWLTANSTLVNPELLQNLDTPKTELRVDKSIIPENHLVIAQNEVIYPRVELNNELRAYRALEIQAADPINKTAYLIWIDTATSEVLSVHNPELPFETQVIGSIVPDKPHDEPVMVNLPFVELRLASKRIMANAFGQIDLTDFYGLKAESHLENSKLVVTNNDAKDNALHFEIDESLAEINFDEGSSLDERNIYYWVMKGFDYLENDLHYKKMTGKITAIARHGDEMDNAYFQPLLNTLAFGVGKTFLENTALSRDVVLHELGHAVTHSIYGLRATYEFMAMNEAFSDYFAATITNDPEIGNGTMRGDRQNLRSLYTDYKFKEFYTGTAFHNDGQLFSGSLWRLRMAIGAKAADELIHEARLANAASITEFWAELRAINDALLDDGDPFSLGDRAEAIRKSFAHHGIDSRTMFNQKSDVYFGKESDDKISNCWTPHSH